MRRLGCDHQDSGGSVEDPLQLLGESLADDVEENVAAVDAKRHEGIIDESLSRLLLCGWRCALQ